MMAYGLQTPDIVGNYVKGRELGRAVEKERREEPYLAKMRELASARQEQALESGQKQMTLQDIAIRDAEKKQESQILRDIGEGAKWADTPEKWQEFLDINQMEGNEVSQFRDKFGMRESFINLADPDYSKQKQAQQNIATLVQQYPEEQRGAAGAIAAVSPQAITKDASERLLSGEERNIEAVVSTMPETSQDTVRALLEFDPSEGGKLVRDIAKAKEKPEKATEGQRLISGYAKRMDTAEDRLKELTTGKDAYEPGGFIDRVAEGTLFFNWMVSPEGQQYANAQKDWVRAKLRRESGAAIGDDEMAQEVKTYFPQPGDAEEVIKQKEERRKIATQGLKDAAGKAYKEEAKKVSTDAAPKLTDEELLKKYGG
jgi:hypothetical protein